MIRSTTFFSVADARQYHCTHIDSSHRDALHDYIVSVLIGNFCLFTTLVFEICVTTKIFDSCRHDERFFVLTLLADRLLVGTCGGGKGATTTAASVQQLEKKCFWK